MTPQRSVLLVPLLFLACTGTTPPNEIPPPDVEKITVFYPIDGLVYGRALPEALPSNIPWVRVQAHPTGTIENLEVNEDGSFDFRLVAISDDTIAVTGMLDKEGTKVGDSAYVKVPQGFFLPEDRVCCLAAGTCQPISDREANKECPDPSQGVITTCTRDEDCGIDEGEYLELDSKKVTITSPNADGEITVKATVTANALITLQNRRFNGLGVRSPITKVSRISSDLGVVEFKKLRARGDDELVMQALDLGGYRSPAVSFKVPDAKLAGVDILGAYAWEPLANGARGKVAIYVSPYGVDGRGICPDSGERPITCYSGGLTHGPSQMADFVGMPTIDMDDAHPSMTSTSASVPWTRGFDGDVRAGPENMVVVIDMSEAAANQDGYPSAAPRRFAAIHSFIESFRARDMVGVVAIGAKEYAPTGYTWLGVGADQINRPGGLRRNDQRPALLAAIDDLANKTPDTGAQDVFSGALAAYDMLRQDGANHGRIIIIGNKEPTDPMLYDELLDKVYPDPLRGFDGYHVDMVGLNLPLPGQDVHDVVAFSAGVYYFAQVDTLTQTLTDLRGQLAGAFILLWDMGIPARSGKVGEIRFTLGVTINGETQSASYTGPLRIQNSTN